ncbi:hypothetical protein BH09BAC3_BH09BAC3_07530 [soil metagenome]
MNVKPKRFCPFHMFGLSISLAPLYPLTTLLLFPCYVLTTRLLLAYYLLAIWYYSVTMFLLFVTMISMFLSTRHYPIGMKFRKFNIKNSSGQAVAQWLSFNNLQPPSIFVTSGKTE